MLNFKNKIISAFLLFFLVATSTLSMVGYYATPAYAGINSFVSAGLSGQNNVVSGMGPGEYHTQGENIYTLGYANLRFNTTGQNLQLFTITPPNFSIGCSGISAEWGAFAMLGSHLMQVLQSIIQSGQVLVFAFNMVLGVLCKQCESIMNQIEAIANKLNGLNFNSCQTAEAMGNIAGAELGNMLGQSGVSGATNSFADSVNTALGNASTAIGKWIGDINTAVNCASTQAGAQALVSSGFSSCGQAAAARKFLGGSLLRDSLTKAHIGLIGGTTPGSGGANGLIGVLRGMFTGDIVGYLSAAKGEPVVRYVPPSSPLSTVAGNNNTLSTPFDVLMDGSQNIISETVKYPPDFTTPASLAAIVSEKSVSCFPGFFAYYLYYLQDVESQYFPLPPPTGLSTSCSGVAMTPLSQQEIYNFVTNSSMPVLLILKLAYVNQDPALVNTAAQAMAAGYAENLFGHIIRAAGENILTAKNIDHKKALKLWSEYISQMKTVRDELKSEHNAYIKELSSEISTNKYYASLNKAWVGSLSRYGLRGAYNFNP